jgi:cobaltochelatase CobS
MTTARKVVSKTLVERYKSSARASKKAEDVEVKVVEPEVLFNEETEAITSSDTDAVMYSATFKGAEEYLKDTGYPDIEVTSLMHEKEDWDESDRAFIPEVNPHYTWQHDILYPALMGLKHKMKILTVGPTGSGKTTFWENLSATFNQPFYRLGGRGDMESDTILGKPSLKDGTTGFTLGEFTKAFVGGYFILLDEPWKLPSYINMTFQRVFERGGVLQIDDMDGELGDKQFAPHKHTHLVLADNVIGTGDGADHYPSTQIQDGSSINRMDMILKIDYLPQDQEVALLMNMFSFLPEEQAVKAVQLANLVRDGFEKRKLTASMSPRNLIAWMESAYEIRDYRTSFKWVMMNRFASEEERGAVAGIWNTVYAEAL